MPGKVTSALEVTLTFTLTWTLTLTLILILTLNFTLTLLTAWERVSHAGGSLAFPMGARPGAQGATPKGRGEGQAFTQLYLQKRIMK